MKNKKTVCIYFLISIFLILQVFSSCTSKKKSEINSPEIPEFFRDYEEPPYEKEKTKGFITEKFDVVQNDDDNEIQNQNTEIITLEQSESENQQAENQQLKNKSELCNYFELNSDENAKQSVIMAPSVKSEMLSPDYWLSKIENPYNLIMTREEIDKWNKDILECQFSPTEYFKIVADIREYRKKFNTQQIRDEMMRYRTGIIWYKKVKNQDKEIIKKLTVDDWLTFYDKMNYELLGTKEYYAYTQAYRYPENINYYPVRKGVCVNRSTLRNIPDETLYTDNPDFWYDDVNLISGILINEPVLILWESKDKQWYLVQTYYSSGWIPKKDVAVCTEEQFSKYFDYTSRSEPDFITITSDQFELTPNDFIFTEDTNSESSIFETSNSENIVNSLENTTFENKSLFMGTYLQLADWKNINISKKYSERIPHSNYLVEIPYKKDDDSLGIHYASIPAANCYKGLVPFSKANVISLAFKSLGKPYGWGGMYNERDCTEYTKDLYRCFGFNFGKNSSAQAAMPGKTISFNNLTHKQRCEILDSLPEGTILYYYGHVFIYLGKNDEDYYVISAMGTYYPDGKGVISNINACSVNVNNLNLIKKDGKSWIDSLICAKLLKY